MIYWLTAFFIFLPFERIPSTDIFGITVRISSAIVLVGLLVWGWNLIRDKATKLNSLDWMGLAIWVVGIFSLFFADDLKRGVLVILLGLYVWLAYFLVSRILIKLDNRGWEIATWSLLAVSTATSIFGMWQFMENSQGKTPESVLMLASYSKAVLGFPRIQSVGLEPLYFANFLLLPVFLLIAGFITAKWSSFVWWKQLPLWLVLALHLVVFILTVSRGAYLAFIFGMMVMMFVLLVYRRKIICWWCVVGVIVVGAFSGFAALRLVYWSSGAKGTAKLAEHVGVQEKRQNLIVSVQNSLNISDSTKELEHLPNQEEVAGVDSRIVQIKEAWRLFKQQPLLGVGIGNFGVASKAPKEVGAGQYQTVNNEYMEVLAEIGIIGFMVLLAWIMQIVLKLLNSFRTENDLYKTWLLLALGATIAGIIIQYNFFSTLYILYIWTVVAMIRAITNLENN